MYTFRDIKVDNKYKITYLLSLFVSLCLLSLCVFLIHLGHLGNNKYDNEHIV